MKRAVFEPGARADVSDAFAYYERQRPGLGFEFRDEIMLSLQGIREHPQAYPEIEDGVRWALLARFPFKLFYLVDEDVVRVLAVLHGARHWEGWRREL
jgi:plasmid stabilization system protein ParE